MRFVIVAFVVSAFLLSCNKDKFNTKPALKLDSVNTKVVDKGDALRFNLNVTDLEGDLTDSMFIYKVVRNCPAGSLKFQYKIPEFPTNKNLDVDIEVGFAYRNTSLGLPSIPEPQCPPRNDSCFFRFVIRDKAGNVSDTVNSPEIVILKP